MYLSHHSEPSRQRGRATGHVDEPFDHLVQFEPAIEAVSEGTEVTTQMFSGDGVISAMDRILDVAEHRVDPGKFLLFNARRAATSINAPMGAGFDDGPEARQSVGGHFGVRRQVLTRPAIHAVAAKAFQRRHTHGQRPTVGAAGHGRNKRRLAGRAAAALAAPALAAPERVVDLYRTGQRLAVVTLAHGFHDLVLEQPGGVVGHTKVPGQGHRRNPGLALCEQKNRQKPVGQGQFGVLEQRSGRQRRLMMAAMALNQRASLQLTAGIVPAFRAAKTLGPAQLEQRCPAGGFGAIFFEEFRQAQTFLKLNRISGHVVTSCFHDGYEISKRHSQ